MERCPPEILHHIFALACKDGGFTGRSLSLVSHTISEKSSYSRLHSVACRGADQILSFARMLDTRPPHLRVVSHLCLTLSYKVSDEANAIACERSGWAARRSQACCHIPYTNVIVINFLPKIQTLS